MSGSQDAKISAKVSNICHEMLNLINAEGVVCSIHESEAITSIVLRSNDIDRAGFTILKSRQTVLKSVKSSKTKMSTNRVRQATELEGSGWNQNPTENLHDLSAENCKQHNDEEWKKEEGQNTEVTDSKTNQNHLPTW